MSFNLGQNEVQIDNDTMIVTETDEKGTILFVSKDFCKVSGYENEELLGEAHNLVRHPFMPKAAFADLWSTIRSGKIWNGIVINKTKNGGYYWVNACVYPSKRRDGSTKYISVRVKPSKEEIENALNLYPTL